MIFVIEVDEKNYRKAQEKTLQPLFGKDYVFKPPRTGTLREGDIQEVTQLLPYCETKKVTRVS